jgi:anti-sigma regulatory factor (Ser/Thr protein kinase)
MTEAAEFELRLEPKLEASAHAREALRSAFGRQLSERVLVDLLTVVGELVTNAVQHGPGRPISLSVSLDADQGILRGEVVDAGDPAKSIPRIREVTTQKGGGYGLRLVDKMTSEWAVVEGSTSVRFEIPLEDG